MTEPFIHFRREGARSPHATTAQRNRRPLVFGEALRCAPDWQSLFDVDDGYSVFPPTIAATTQRPDAVCSRTACEWLYSLSSQSLWKTGWQPLTQSRIVATQSFWPLVKQMVGTQPIFLSKWIVEAS